MHDWGDGWPYWDELWQAETTIVKAVKKYTRCILISKEKYGTIRYEYMFPPYCRVWYSNKLNRWWQQCWITHLWCKLGFYVAKRVILRILRDKPYLAEELLNDAVVDDRFKFDKYMAVLCGWRSEEYGNWRS